MLNKQVELSDAQDGPLYLLIEAMLLGIRQFFTYVEMLDRSGEAPTHRRFREVHRPPDTRQAYFDALELLRGHLSRCLGQIVAIAGPGRALDVAPAQAPLEPENDSNHSV